MQRFLYYNVNNELETFRIDMNIIYLIVSGRRFRSYLVLFVLLPIRFIDAIHMNTYI